MSNKLFSLPIINNIIRYEETDSTNTRAKEFGNRGSVHGTLITADCQTRGKGRLGRNFASPSKSGIYMSLLLRPEIDINAISEVTLLAGLSVAKAIKMESSNHDVKIKWPNDVLVDNKKISGILTEANFDKKLNYIIVGIGINVNTPFFDDSIKDTATSLFLTCNKTFDTEEILYNTLNLFNDYYDIWIKDKDLKSIITEYNDFLISYNKDIYVVPHELSKKYENPYNIEIDNLEPMICKGINTNGEMICENHNGKIEIVRSGEVSIRGLHSYAI